MNILDVAENISRKLNIDPNKLKDIIELKIPERDRIINEQSLLNKINLLLESDDQINKFQSRLNNPVVLANFNTMKEKLGELQILALIKKLEKSESCDDVLNSFLVVLNNKFESVNNILEESLNQSGGSKNIDYYLKYLKYKLKNDRLEALIGTNNLQ